MAKPIKSKKRVEPISRTQDPLGIYAMIERFLCWMRERNFSEQTIIGRERHLRVFMLWCEERGVTRPSEVTKPMIERYQRWLFHYRQKTGRPLSFSSQINYLVPLRAYFKWLARQNYILYNPASEIELPRVEQRLPKHVLTATEAEAVLNRPNVKTAIGIRDRAILETFYATGIRRMEMINLKIYDLDTERETLIVRQGKGRKDRIIPISERAIDWIDKYMLEVRAGFVVAPDDGTLFLTTSGESFSLHRLGDLVRQYIDEADIGKRGSCHLFRHTLATLMLENGADIRYIQQMLGHANVSTTEIYTRVSIRTLKQIYTATHPGARLDNKMQRIYNSNEESSEESQDREALLNRLALEEIEEEY